MLSLSRFLLVLFAGLVLLLLSPVRKLPLVAGRMFMLAIGRISMALLGLLFLFSLLLVVHL